MNKIDLKTQVEADIPEERKQIFADLPHRNPFYDIPHAIDYVIPLHLSYSLKKRDVEHEKTVNEKAGVIRSAYEKLKFRTEKVFVESFHALAREFLKEYRNFFPDKQIEALVSPRGNNHKRAKSSYLDSPRIARDAILKQEAIAIKYFDPFYKQSLLYLQFVEENDAAGRAAAQKKSKN